MFDSWALAQREKRGVWARKKIHLQSSNVLYHSLQYTNVRKQRISVFPSTDQRLRSVSLPRSWKNSAMARSVESVLALLLFWRLDIPEFLPSAELTDHRSNRTGLSRREYRMSWITAVQTQSAPFQTGWRARSRDDLMIPNPCLSARALFQSK